MLDIPWNYLLELLDNRIAGRYSKDVPVYVEDDLYWAYNNGSMDRYRDASTPEPNLLFRNYILRPESSKPMQKPVRGQSWESVIEGIYDQIEKQNGLLAELVVRVEKLEKGVKKWR